ncbi:phosphotransferase [Sulfobacillus harzensis]|uniref:Phosphotransferase n=1 Tax=Sulfobacillus harzensis TaxID=2729629 RepID=A0A7Y0L7L2_9FIRM|nr:phosphotransferase [Sulfobacillus harzensis]NMP23394.1 phosphotransferase [Sulfobacillus harzensis]
MVKSTQLAEWGEALSGKTKERLSPQSVAHFWPQVNWQEAVWLNEGWDFVVVVVDGMALRIPRSPAGQWRLRRERALLDRLDNPPVAIPRYQQVQPGLYGYPFIAGDTFDSVAASDALRAAVLAFCHWLHDTPSFSRDDAAVRRRWHARYRARSRASLRDVSPLLSHKEARKMADIFLAGDEALLDNGWPVALLHGDLAPEHILVRDNVLVGVIDFGDWRFGDAVFDWTGIPAVDRVLPVPLSDGQAARLRAYRLLAESNQVRHALKEGNVERAEWSVRVLRRNL